MKILFAGTPANAAEILEFLVRSGHQVVVSLTKEDSIQNRTKDLLESEVATKSKELAIPVIKANTVTPEVIERIKSFSPDLAVVVAYGSLLNHSTLRALEVGWFNLHYSLLPEFRGAAPVQHALISGKNETGVTLFRIDEGMDTGPILAQVSTHIAPDESAGELLGRLTELSKTLLSQELPKIYSGMSHEEVQSGKDSQAPKLSRDDARIDTGKPALAIHNLIRAMNPEPVAWLKYKGESFRILESRVQNAIQTEEPGQILGGKNPVMVCGDGHGIELIKVQPFGKKVMSGADWFRGQTDLGRFR
jgi:methionyl-tRNA formyltransferase